MAGAAANAEAAAGFPASPLPPRLRELFPAAGGGASSPRWRQRRRLRLTVPPGPGLGLLALVFLRFCCSTLAEPFHLSHVTAVWGKTVELKCVVPVKEAKIMHSYWEKKNYTRSEVIAVRSPVLGITIKEDYEGRMSFKSNLINDATFVLNNVSLSDAGEYICKAVTFPLGTMQSSTTVTVLVEPLVSLIKGPNPLIDGARRTIAATCTAATGKPAAEIDWEGGLGEMESISTLFPNGTVTVVSHYMIVPTRFAKGRVITCIVKHPTLEKEIRYPHVLDIQYAPEVSVTGYDGNWFIGGESVQLRCNADANPLPMEFMWTRYDGQWPEGLLSVNNTLQFSSPLTYSYIGTYICKVTNSIGQRSDQKTIYLLDPPATTTRLPTVPWHPPTAGERGIPVAKFPTTTLPPKQEDTWGTVICSALGGAVVFILGIVLFGVIRYRRRWMFRGDCFAKNCLPPSDMQQESQIDVPQSGDVDSQNPRIPESWNPRIPQIDVPQSGDVDSQNPRIPESWNPRIPQIDVPQSRDVDSYPASIKKDTKRPVDVLTSKYYSKHLEKPDCNYVDNTSRYQGRYERPIDCYEGGALGMEDMGGERYYDNEDDVISYQEWYV